MSEKRFFCIRGHMKSGTNWICRLLNLHPDIDCRGEYHWQRYFEAYQVNRNKCNNIEKTEAEKAVIRRGLSEFVRSSMLQRADSNAKLIGDRTPHTIVPVVIPKAPHISVIRDCRDVLVSKMFHCMNTKNASKMFMKNEKLKAHFNAFKEDPWYFQKFPQRLLANEKFVRHTCSTWAHYIRADKNAAERKPQLPIMFVQYEKVHEDIYKALDRMYGFLKVDSGQVKTIPDKLMPGHKKETPNQFNRKGKVGDWQNYVTDRVKNWINEEAGTAMLEQGYIDSLDWEVSNQNRRKSAA